LPLGGAGALERLARAEQQPCPKGDGRLALRRQHDEWHWRSGRSVGRRDRQDRRRRNRQHCQLGMGVGERQRVTWSNGSLARARISVAPSHRPASANVSSGRNARPSDSARSSSEPFPSGAPASGRTCRANSAAPVSVGTSKSASRPSPRSLTETTTRAQIHFRATNDPSPRPSPRAGRGSPHYLGRSVPFRLASGEIWLSGALAVPPRLWRKSGSVARCSASRFSQLPSSPVARQERPGLELVEGLPRPASGEGRVEGSFVARKWILCRASWSRSSFAEMAWRRTSSGPPIRVRRNWRGQFAQTLERQRERARSSCAALSLGRALRPDETFADAGLWDGANADSGPRRATRSTRSLRWRSPTPIPSWQCCLFRRRRSWRSRLPTLRPDRQCHSSCSAS